MGRDKVLGLSLAILLIGFAGAFCFRNEEFVENGLKLAKARILDQHIDQRPGPKPYIADKSDPPAPKPAVTLGTIEAIEPAEPPKKAQTAERDRPIVTDSEETLPYDGGKLPTEPIDQFVSVRKERSAAVPVSVTPSPSKGPLTSSNSNADNPIELTIRPNSPAFDPPDSLLEDAATWQHSPDGRDGCPAMAGHDGERSNSSPLAASTASTAPITYTVRRGDTLSRIAQHFLGDSNRYREIFAANRGQLQSPNARLRVGMTLQIPADRPRTKRTGSLAVSQAKSTRGNNPPAESPHPKQVPARAVSRTREVSKPQSGKDERSPSASSSVDGPQDATGQIRFVPATKGPFWRSQGEPGSGTGSRDLTQRPPAVRGQSAADREGAGHSNGNSRDRSRSTATLKPQSERPTPNSDGSEEM